jgi:hypothetical protein
MINIIFIIVLFINGLLQVANADTKDFNQHMAINYEQLEFKEVGRAKFSVLFWDIYNSTLYTHSGSYLHELPPKLFMFKVEYLKDISTDDLLERTIDQWQHLDIPESQYTPYISQLKNIWPNITAGDSLTMLVENNKSIFYFNNVKVGVISEQGFSKLFLDIWLSSQTSQPKLRAQLLKGNK